MFSKEIVRGTLKTLVLKVLDESPRMYGYQLIKEIKKRTEGKIVLTEGALYPLLHRLYNEKLVEIEEQRTDGRIRKYYRLTVEGREKSAEKTMELLDFMRTLATFIKSQHSA